MNFNLLMNKLRESKRVELFLRSEVKVLRNEISQLRKERISVVFRIKRKYRKVFAKKYFAKYGNAHRAIIDDTTIIIPVFGRLELFGELIDDLKNMQNSFPCVKIIIVDDKYDNGSSIKIDEICSAVKNLNILRNDKNIGYLNSINAGFKLVDTQYAILLNSDVRIPENWLPRMTKPFLSEEIALATCLTTDGESNLSLEFPTNFNWKEIDKLISGLESNYLPDACTAVGYCVAVRVRALEGEDVYDESFSPAYGEDSDLHYRMKNKGWRSVVVNNLLIKHHGGASYGDSDETKQMRERSMNLFLNKWGREFLVDEIEFMRNNPVERVRDFIAYQSQESLKYDVIFLSPTNNSEIGGMNVLSSLANQMTNNGLKVGLICLNYDPVFSASNFKIMTQDHINLISGVDFVISSGLEVVNLLKNLRDRFTFKLINIIQGPEYLMDNKFFKKDIFDLCYNEAFYNIIVSPYLEENMKFYDIPNTKIIPIGPDSRIFYDDFQERDNNILIPCRSEEMKGTDLAIALVPILKQKGWKVYGYGDLLKEENVDIFDNFYGRLSRNKVADLMRKNKLLLDLSIYEGLGLSPIESAMCGCIPVISNRGGNQSLEKYLGQNVPWITVKSSINFADILKSIDSANMIATIDFRMDYEKVLNELNFNKGAQELIALIK